MDNDGRFARVLRGIAALGLDRLRELAARTNAKVAPGDDARGLATALLTRLERPDELRHQGLTDAEVETVGTALGLGTRVTWRPNVSPEEFERLPFYAKPSYESAVWDALGASPSAPAPAAKSRAAAKPAKAEPARAKAPAKASAKAKPAPAKAKPAQAKAPAKAKPAQAKTPAKAKPAQAKASAKAKPTRAKAGKATKRR